MRTRSQSARRYQFSHAHGTADCKLHFASLADCERDVGYDNFIDGQVDMDRCRTSIYGCVWDKAQELE
jgi:hypothetical protein